MEMNKGEITSAKKTGLSTEVQRTIKLIATTPNLH